MKALSYLCLFFLFGCLSREPVSTTEQRVRLGEPIVTKYAGDTLRVRLPVLIVDPFHIQANPVPFPYLIPTSFELIPGQAARIQEITYPSGKPYVLEGSPDTLSVYDGQIEIGLSIILDPSFKETNQHLTGKLGYQACDHRTCFRPTAIDVHLDLISEEEAVESS